MFFRYIANPQARSHIGLTLLLSLVSPTALQAQGPADPVPTPPNATTPERTNRTALSLNSAAPASTPQSDTAAATPPANVPVGPKPSFKQCEQRVKIPNGQTDKGKQVSSPADLYKLADCAKPEVMCLGTDGVPFWKETFDELEVGTEYTVKLIGVKACQSYTLLGVSKHTSSDQLFKSPTQSGEAGLVEPSEASFELDVLDQSTIKVSRNDRKVFLRVLLKAPDGSRKVVNETEVDVHLARYYLDVALLVPVVFDGKRTFELHPAEGDNQGTVALEEDYLVRAGVALNVYPFGRREGEIAYHPDSLRNVFEPLGLQFGIDADPTKIGTTFFTGAVLELVAGVGISGGVALVSLDRLGNGVKKGDVISQDQELKTKNALKVRPYFGVYISSEVLNTIQTLGKPVIKAVSSIPNQ